MKGENIEVKTSHYAENLIFKVIERSNSSNWKNAVHEWDIVGWQEDTKIQSSCICGKDNIRYLFTIENNENGNILEPIGSHCIKKFKRKELDEITAIYEDLFKLNSALGNKRYITLSSEYFSRKLLMFFYEKNVFVDSKYNNFNGEKDYQFMLDMFNKRDKDSITKPQQSKINGIIVNQIIPFLELQLNKAKN